VSDDRTVLAVGWLVFGPEFSRETYVIEWEVACVCVCCELSVCVWHGCEAVFTFFLSRLTAAGVTYVSDLHGRPHRAPAGCVVPRIKHGAVTDHADRE